MYHMKDDQRSIHSCEMIYNGLAALIQERPFDSISVSDLVETAQVGRATFYRNFDIIEDVLQMRCDQVADRLVDYVQEYQRNHQHEPHTKILKPVLVYFYMHSELIELLLRAKRIHLFEETIFNHFVPFKPIFGEYFGIEEMYVEYVMLMRIGGLTKVLIHWVETGKKQAPDELADRLGLIIGTMIALEQLL